MRSLPLALLATVACRAPPAEPPAPFTVVTFNTGTTPGLNHDAPPDDGYTQAEAEVSDTWYGDGLAWLEAIDAAMAWLVGVDPDIVVFQEVFWIGDCPTIPPEHHAGFACARWGVEDPTVAQVVLGPDWQVACHPGKPDKCAAVHRRFGTFRGCNGDLCLEGLDGTTVEGCGSGARVGRGSIDRVDGGPPLTLVSVHGSSGFEPADQQCRVAQFDQVFLDLGDGEPAANGTHNLVLGDLNTDPGRLVGTDPSADRLARHLRDRPGFAWLTEVGFEAPPTYGGLFNIDHVLSDHLEGSCTHPGLAGSDPVFDAVYFDHLPVVCEVASPR